MPRSIHTIGRHLTSELRAWLAELRTCAVVYAHATTADYLSALHLARAAGEYDAFAPACVVWLETRPGEYHQREIDAALIADPLARTFAIAGTLCEGAPRSGKLLADVTRFYWHQQPAMLIGQLSSAPPSLTEIPGLWITIHARQLANYQSLAGLCQAALRCRTIWQDDQCPVVASEPDVRLFWGWPAWEAWQATPGGKLIEPAAPAILLLDFPRHADFARARSEHIAQLLAMPCRAAELGPALRACRQSIQRQNVAVLKPQSRPRAYRLTA